MPRCCRKQFWCRCRHLLRQHSQTDLAPTMGSLASSRRLTPDTTIYRSCQCRSSVAPSRPEFRSRGCMLRTTVQSPLPPAAARRCHGRCLAACPAPAIHRQQTKSLANSYQKYSRAPCTSCDSGMCGIGPDANSQPSSVGWATRSPAAWALGLRSGCSSSRDIQSALAADALGTQAQNAALH